jgi:hypothetical protein
VGAAPRIRPIQVWVLSVLLILIGIAGIYLSVVILEDAVDHGEETSVVVLSAVSLAFAVAQTVSGVLLFVGIEWGRRLAIAVCLVNLVAVVWSAFLSIGDVSRQIFFAGLVNGALTVALLGGRVSSWCTSGR